MRPFLTPRDRTIFAVLACTVSGFEGSHDNRTIVCAPSGFEGSHDICPIIARYDIGINLKVYHFLAEDPTMWPPGSWRVVVFTLSYWPRAMWWSADRIIK